MAHRCQRIDLRTCLLSLFQWYSPQICSTHCHFSTRHLFVWRNYMAYVSLFLPHQYVVGRSSQRWSYRNILCFRFRQSRSTTTGTFCRRSGRRREYRRSNDSNGRRGKRRERTIINANSCHRTVTTVPSYWHNYDIGVAQLCHHGGTVNIIAFQFNKII